MLWKNKLYFDHEEMLKKCLILHVYRLLDMPIPMAQALRLYTPMFLSNGLYICSILETAHDRTTFGIFCTLLKILYLKKMARKCSLFLHQLYFFLRDNQGLFWDKDQISSGEDKRKG